MRKYLSVTGLIFSIIGLVSSMVGIYLSLGLKDNKRIIFFTVVLLWSVLLINQYVNEAKIGK